MTETNTQDQEAPPELDLLRRERADFLNYKRRIAAERIDDCERARQDLIRELLPAIDDLDRAMTHLPAQLGTHPWVKGVELARERFLDTLRRLGVERIGTQGEHFDPSVHDAIVYQEQPESTDQHVDSVLRPGYRMGPQLLRPAQVMVSGPPRNGRHSDNGQSTGN